MQIRIYDKNFTPLTVLFKEFTNLSYGRIALGVGSASFTVTMDSAKITETNLKHYNRIEICDDDNTVRWVGVIVSKTVTLNTIEVRCYELAHLLDRRLTGDPENYATTAIGAITAVLDTANSAEATGITAGTIDATGNVNVNFTRSSVLQAIKTIADAVGGQFAVGLDRKLHFRDTLGTDKSASVIFKYEAQFAQQSNLVKFSVVDNGIVINTQTFGKSGAFTSTQTNATLQAKYGLLQKFENFREVANGATLDGITATRNKDAQFSPDLALKPGITDNFDIFDTVQIIVKNDFVDIDQSYQVLEKTVTVVAGIKQIAIKIKTEETSIDAIVRDMNKKLELLNRAV